MIRTACYSLLCLMVAATANAQQNPDKSDTKKSSAKDHTEKKAALPQYLKQLNLDKDQKQNIKQAIKAHDQELAQTWKKFHKQHARAIELEAVWLAAVRDSLSEEDRQKFDQQRSRDQHSAHESQADARENQKESAKKRSAQNRQETDRQASGESTQDAQTQRGKSRSDSDDHAANRTDQDRYGIVLIRMVSPERYLRGVSQSSEQKQQCSEACRKYKQKLTSTWKGLHRTHAQLVQIEADRLEAIEGELTDKQLKMLKKHREAPSQQSSETTASTPQDAQQQ